MSTAITPEVRKTKIPSVNPYVAPNVICSNRDCLRPMKPKVNKDKGGEPVLQYDCEHCNYSLFASLVHAQGQCKPIGAPTKNLPEIFQKSNL